MSYQLRTIIAALQLAQKVVPPSLSWTLPVKMWCKRASGVMRRARAMIPTACGSPTAVNGPPAILTADDLRAKPQRSDGG